MRPSPNATGDLIISDTRLGVGTTDNLSTLTVRARPTFQLTGTLSKTENTVTVTGLGTAFESELTIGDRITLSSGMLFDQVRTVVGITNNTTLTVEVPFLTTETAMTAEVMPSSIRVDNSSGTPRFVVNDAGSVGIGTVGTQAQLHVSGAGSGHYADRAALIRAHMLDTAFRGTHVVLSHGAGAHPPGVGLFACDDTSGFPALRFSFNRSQDDQQPCLALTPNGLIATSEVRISALTVTGDYTIGPGDHYVYVDAGTAAVTITLPAISGNNGRIVHVFKADGTTNEVTIAAHSGDNINGASANKIISTPFGGIQFVGVAGIESAPGTWVGTAQSAAV